MFDMTKLLAKSLFPKERWMKISKNVYLAKSRLPENKRQTEILQKEIIMAKTLAKYGHIVYLLPEKAKTKTPDALVDGTFTEFKEVTGNMNSLGQAYKRALKQGTNIFLKALGKNKRFVIDKIVGEILMKLEHNKCFDLSAKIYLQLEEETVQTICMKKIMKTRPKSNSQL